MWNSPREERNLQLTPQQIRGLIATLSLDFDRYEDGPESGATPFIYSPGPYQKLPPRLLLCESAKVMETLVTAKPVPKGGHNALEECLLYSYCRATLEEGSEFEAEPNMRKYAKQDNLPTVNAIRELAGERPARSLKNVGEGDWNDTLDAVFFHDRDWEMVENLKGTRALNAEVGIGGNYFAFPVTDPGAGALAKARARLNALAEWAEKSPEPLPEGFFASKGLEPTEKKKPSAPTAKDTDLSKAREACNGIKGLRGPELAR
jgi:hypothetical protein